MGDNASFQILNINDILPNRFQPRIKFEDESLDELAESINRFGVIEPIVVRPIGNKYEIIAGERRFKASKLASKTTIPSIVISLTDKDSEELALLENVQRQSLNPIEEAVSYKRILDMGYISREELSKKIGKSQSEILNKTRLLNLADEVQSYLLNNKISEGHARALLCISNLDDQVKMLHRIVNERLTVKKTNREIRNYLEKNKDDTEFLFDDERGNDKMDIDKIMREAQDINTESNVNIEAPDLMAAPADASLENNAQIFQSMPVNSENVVSKEPNKFVNVSTLTDNQMPINGQKNTGQESLNNIANDMFSSSIGVQAPTSVINNNIDNVQAPISAVNNDVLSSPSLNTEPVISSSEGAQSIPTVSNPAQSETNTVQDSNLNNSMDAEISSIVSDALKNQPLVNQNMTENTQVPNTSLENIPDFNINTPVSNEAVQTETINNEMGMLNQGVDNNLHAPVDNSADLNAPIINQQLESSESNLDGASAGSFGISPTPQANISSSIPDFGKIVQKLRECADEIEKSGHFINLEEIDLGNQYKVIFTFDK